MFTKIKNIDTAFQHVRNFTIVVILGSFSICGFTIYKSYLLVNESKNRIYVLAGGKVLDAYSSERKENIAIEAIDHVATFHQYFFSLDPDNQVIEENINKALYLADASAKDQYEILKESGFYTSIISGNISQRVKIDSIRLDMDEYPYLFKCYAIQRIIRKTSIVTRSLQTEGFLRSVSRSKHNSHGFLIERWTTLENKDIKTQNR